MKRQLDKEQFFTTDENAKFCISKININDFERIIEPSAGSGSFSNKINCIAYDIEPLADGIIKQDFLSLDIKKDVKTLVIGNPPFGRQSSLAIKFINKSAKFADTIAFILPLSFKKESVINKLDEHLHLENVYELIDNTFYFEDKTFKIPCAFFVFKYKDNLREKPKKETTEDFEFVKKEKADCSVRRVGFYSGKLEGLDVSESSHYFIKWKNSEAENIFKQIKFTFDNTVGPRSVSQNEIIKAYNLKKHNGN